MTEAGPLVSVVIPARNRAHTLERALRSVLTQDSSDMEILVVDDASTDETPEVVRGLHDSRIRLLEHAERRGGSAARNTGIRDARGKYIALLDSDDEWLPGKLALQVTTLREASERVGLVLTGFERIWGDEGVETLFPKIPDDLHRRMLFHGNLLRGATSSALIRRECFEVAGLFDERLPAAQDYDMWVRITKHFDAMLIPEVLVRVFADLPDRISLNLEAKSAASFIISEKYRDEMTWFEYRCLKARRLARSGYKWYLAGSKKRARPLVLRALVTWPFSKRAWLYALVTLVPLRLYLRARSLFRPFRNVYSEDL